jgi:two-component system OmpR family response regulator
MSNSILIIDDEEDICLLLSAILKKRDFKVSFKNTLEEGLSALKSKPPALLFLDLNLPDGYGLDYVDMIKKQLPALKIIIISAYDGPKERGLASEKGVDMFIGKPFNRDIINRSVDHLMA